MTKLTNSTIAILGGAGKAGQPLVLQALNAGYRVRALLRHPEQFTITDERLDIIQGDARDTIAIRALLHGCSALISTLGHPRGESIPILSTVTGHILSAMRELGMRRYVTVTSLYTTANVQQDIGTQQAAAFMQQHFPEHMADRAREYQLLRDSDVDWAYVRLPYLVQTPAIGKVITHLDYLPGQQITTTDLACFLVAQLESSAYSRQAPFIANG